MSYETRRMALKHAERQVSTAPLASADHLRVALAARSPGASPHQAGAAAATPAPAPVPVAAQKGWAAGFYQAAESSGQPLATLNAIVAVCDSHDEAMQRLNARVDRPAADTPSRTGDEAAAQRILAAHAKAHQPKGPARHR